MTPETKTAIAWIVMLVGGWAAAALQQAIGFPPVAIMPVALVVSILMAHNGFWIFPFLRSRRT